MSKSQASQKRVLLVGQSSLLRTNLQGFLRLDGGSCVCDQTVEGRLALPTMVSLHPDVMVADMSEANRTWIKLIKQIKALMPEMKMVAVCGRGDPATANRLLRAGSDGYVLAEEPADEITDAIDDVLAGGIYVSEKVLAVSGRRPRPSLPKPGNCRTTSRSQDSDVLKCRSVRGRWWRGAVGVSIILGQKGT